MDAWIHSAAKPRPKRVEFPPPCRSVAGENAASEPLDDRLAGVSVVSCNVDQN